MVRFDIYDFDTAGVGNDKPLVDRESVHPLAVDAKHVDYEVSRCFGAVYRSLLPG